jgi:hypothetical protein
VATGQGQENDGLCLNLRDGRDGTDYKYHNPRKTRTIMVLIAVAKSESVFLMPHFASMDVRPAKKADSAAITSHNIVFLL